MRKVMGVMLVVLAVGGVLAGSSLAATPQEQQFALAWQRAVKIAVKTEGWHRVGFAELRKAGFAVPGRTSTLQLFVEGQQVPIRVTTTGIEFYGVPLDTVSTNRQTYWLVAGTKAGKRIATVKGSVAAAPLVRSTQAKVISTPTDGGYYAALHNGEASNFFGRAVQSGAEIKETLKVARLDTAASAGSLQVALHGYSLLPHRVRVSLNGTELGTASFTGQVPSVTRYAVPAGLLKEGDNVVGLQARAGELDFSLVDSLELTYQRLLIPDKNVLDFVLPAGRRARIDGFTRRTVRLIDVTVPTAPVTVRAVVKPLSGGFSLTVGPAARTRHLVAFGDGAANRPAAVLKNTRSRWNATGQGADLVVITHSSFAGALAPLVAARQRAGLKVALIDVEDLYDEFAFGAHGPKPITDFLAWARAKWKPAPRYVLLVGDASDDPRNEMGKGDFDLLPTKHVDTQYLETASDDSLADFDGDGVPELAVGRLPVRTVEQATAVVTKLLAYETGSPSGARQMVLVSDKPIDYDFEAASKTLYGLLPSASWTTQAINRREGPNDAAVRTRLVDVLNQGPAIVNFFGHGSIQIWTSGSILRTRDAALLQNRRLSLYVMMTCLNGYFTAFGDTSTSLGEALLTAPSGGAVAVWSSTGETVLSGQVTMDQKALGLLLSKPETTLGDAMVQAKAAVGDVDVRRTWVLFGDPTMRLR